MTALLPRPRLLAVLAGRWDQPAAAVVAGAGFGKSTLLLASLDAPRQGCDDRYHAVGPGAGAEELVEGVAGAWQLGVPPTTVIEAAPWLAAAWWAMSPTPVCTTVDDAHHLDERGRLLLEELAAALPPNAHLVIASRTAVVDDVPILLDAAALRFTDEEVAGMAATSGAAIADLAGLGGWPAAVALTAGAGGAGRVDEGVDEAWRAVLGSLGAPGRRAVAAPALAGPCDEATLERLLGTVRAGSPSAGPMTPGRRSRRSREPTTTGEAMPRITPNLWFDTQGEEAAEFYVSVFPNSEITNVTYYGEAGPGPAGTVLTVDFVLDGQDYTAINGGPEFTFNEAISLLINCADQAEVDHYWATLTEGGEEVQCGWLKDRYGLSWQVVPAGMGEMLSDPDPGRSERAMRAMLGMKKIDLAAIHAAADQG